MNTINTYIGNKPPKNSNTIWLRPLKQGGVGFYVWVNNKWNTIKLMDSKGSRTPMDDTPIDIDGDSDHYYTKDQIDDKFADILGLDASGIAELKALLEDDDALTGLLGEINDKLDKDAENIVTGSIKASVLGGYKLTNSAAMGVIMGNTNSTYSALTSTGIQFTNSTGGQSDALFITGNKTDGRVKVGIFASPDAAYKDLAYTNDIPTSLAQLSDDTTHRTVTDEDKTMWNYVSNQFKNTLIEDHISGTRITTASFTAEHSGTFQLQGTLSTTGSDVELEFEIYRDRGGQRAIVYREVITVTPSDPSATINIEQEVESGDDITWSTTFYSIYDVQGSVTTCQINYIDLSTLASVAMSGSYNDLSNTPSIPDAQIQSDWNQTDTDAKDFIKNKPTIPAAQVQADWDETDQQSKAYIANKPTIPSYSSATTSQLGLLKVSNKKSSTQTLTEAAGTTSNRYYGVQMDSNGVAFVNVPWEGTSQTTSYTSGVAMSTNTIYQLTGSNGTNTVANNTRFILPAISGNTGKAIFIIFKPAGSVSFTCETSGRILYNKGNVSSFESSYIYSASAINDGYRWVVSINKTDSSL